MTNQEKIHAFVVMKMRISNLLVKSVFLFRDKSKFESLLSVINSLQFCLLVVSGPAAWFRKPVYLAIGTG